MSGIEIEGHARGLPGWSDECWYACEYPERPYVYGATWFEESCRSCIVALGAAAMRSGSLMVGSYPDPLDPTVRTGGSLSEFYETFRKSFDLPRLKPVA